MRIVVSFLAFFLFAENLPAADEVARAKNAYDRTEYELALSMLDRMPLKTAAAWNLAGRSWLMKGEFKRACEALEKAVALEPASDDHYAWLGRAYGRRAETSSMFTAPRYAGLARDNFEKAVQLNPKNGEAMGDLFEYYLNAPGFLGGGFDKAAKLADKFNTIDPAEKHYALARLAEQKKDWKTMESQLRRAFELAPRSAGRALDLAQFLSRQGRVQESDAAFVQALKIHPDEPKLMLGRARMLIEQKRNLSEARMLLERYLNASLTPDNEPKEEARKLLAKLNQSPGR
jgi:tetratricopeptide (TPR) repeat protein